MDVNLIREKFQELGNNDPNKGNYKSGYLQALNDALDVVKLFAIPDISYCSCEKNSVRANGDNCYHCFDCKKPIKKSYC